MLLLSQYVETGDPVRALARDPRGFGYLLKDRVADADELLDALRRVATGGSAVDPRIVERLMNRARPRRPTSTRSPRASGKCWG
ncbi:DNA-binding response regulator OS=Streptomyces fumanus OX=67302 GN=GCM10018772_34830 PE=4 SV=1 [Streptomyces fumanus]